MKKTQIKPLTAVMGAALMTIGGASVTHAAENPFATQALSSGYNLASKECKKDDKECTKKHSKKAEGKCGEGKCGGDKTSNAEGKCGEGKCGGDKASQTEGKCGEGKCGGSK